MSRLGIGQVIRPTTAAAATWRGLSLHKTGSDTFTGIDFLDFDELFADTDSIRSTGTHTFGAITVGTGAAGVVPTGMAGLWRLAAQSEFARVTSDHVEFDVVINNFAEFISSSYALSGGPFPDQLHLTIGPFVLELAEGDVVWCDVHPATGDIDAGFDATLLMEYLGPA